ncbi:LLM class flavin-dependent oxidoreductase [Amycolatopsis saalfeldensis]|uniref:Luciferase-like monooxygenase n=1 Tax=Amycolatopsis saalfeldensis TaxID=394193 RepID=A0A1H8YFS4_9PSEU|nr:LLM class flavin-dependent oxidoreductase [Amycolatopsis saalfeldensis]SEP50881.1 Luciferase-like monooxygenase [Amycolatopsis saalfeldensis]
MSVVRHGVYLPPFGPFGEPSVLVDLAVRAEAAGWDGVFLWDHVVTDAMPIADTWTTLAAIAQATTTLRLGPMVTPLARRRPWSVARQAATVSRLSGGRLVLGTGLGSDESGDFSRFGEPAGLAERSSRFDEGLEVLRAMLSGDAVRHHGEHYQVTLEPAAPSPIPLWTAASTSHPHVLDRAAASDGFFPNPGPRPPEPEELARLVTRVRPAGRPFDVAVAGNASPAWDEPTGIDLRALAEAGMTWWMESLIHFDPLELSLEVVDAGPPAI